METCYQIWWSVYTCLAEEYEWAQSILELSGHELCCVCLFVCELVCQHTSPFLSGLRVTSIITTTSVTALKFWGAINTDVTFTIVLPCRHETKWQTVHNSLTHDGWGRGRDGADCHASTLPTRPHVLEQPSVERFYTICLTQGLLLQTYVTKTRTVAVHSLLTLIYNYINDNSNWGTLLMKSRNTFGGCWWPGCKSQDLGSKGNGMARAHLQDQWKKSGTLYQQHCSDSDWFTNWLTVLCVCIMCACLVLYYVNQDLHEKLQVLQMQYFLLQNNMINQSKTLAEETERSGHGGLFLGVRHSWFQYSAD